MSQQVDPPPLSIAPPGPIRVAGLSVGAQALGMVAFAAATVVSGARNRAPIGELLAQGGYFVVLAVFVAAVAAALLRGRRWGRTPALVLEIIVTGIGFYLAVPSGQPAAGLAVMLVGIGTGYLLLSRPANQWIGSFPPMFGPDSPDD